MEDIAYLAQWCALSDMKDTAVVYSCLLVEGILVLDEGFHLGDELFQLPQVPLLLLSQHPDMLHIHSFACSLSVRLSPRVRYI